jgi:hypothetical protein
VETEEQGEPGRKGVAEGYVFHMRRRIHVFHMRRRIHV